MKQALFLILAALVVAARATAGPHVSINIGVSPFVFGGYAPPVVYPPPVYYPPPAVVYLGGGYWGGRDHRRGYQDRGHQDRGHQEHGRHH